MNWIILIVAGPVRDRLRILSGKDERGHGSRILLVGSRIPAVAGAQHDAAGQGDPIAADRHGLSGVDGIGAVGTVLAGILFLNEPATFPRIFFLLLLIGAIVGLKLVGEPH